MANKRQRKKKMKKEIESLIRSLEIKKETSLDELAAQVNEISTYITDTFEKPFYNSIISRIGEKVHIPLLRVPNYKRIERITLPEISLLREPVYKKIETIPIPNFNHFESIPPLPRISIPPDIDMRDNQVYDKFIELVFFAEMLKIQHITKGFKDVTWYQAKGMYTIIVYGGEGYIGETLNEFTNRIFLDNYNNDIDIIKSVYAIGVVDLLETSIFRYTATGEHTDMDINLIELLTPSSEVQRLAELRAEDNATEMRNRRR